MGPGLGKTSQDHYIQLRGSTHYYKPTKALIGYNKHLERMRLQGKVHSAEFNTLIVRGTFDKLAPSLFSNCRKILKEHPADKGYFKEVLVLSDRGRGKLLKLRAYQEVRAATLMLKV